MDLVTHYYELLVSKLLTWSDLLVANLPNLIIGAVLLLATNFGARLVRKYTQKLLAKITDNVALTRLGATLLSVATVCLGIFLVLSVLNLDKTVTSLLAGAGILGLALSFAFQDTAANFIAGIIIAVRKPFKVGDHIDSNDKQGIVTRITLRSTIIKTFQGQMMLIPNKDVYQQVLTNFASSGERRVDLSLGVSYSDDLDKARKVALAAIEALECRDQSREVTLVYTGFGSSSIDFDIRYWVQPAQQDYLIARSLGIVAIKQAFDKHGITIPFPIRTLEISAGSTKALQALVKSKEPETAVGVE